MADTLEREHLARADRHIAGSKDRIARQKELIAESAAAMKPMWLCRCCMPWSIAATPLGSIAKWCGPASMVSAPGPFLGDAREPSAPYVRLLVRLRLAREG